MRNTFFLLLFLISGVCFSQNPDPFWDGIRTKLVQPDTLSTFDRDALTPKLGTILYHKDTGISQWEQWDGTNWVEFGGDTSGFVTLTTNQTITGAKIFDTGTNVTNISSEYTGTGFGLGSLNSGTGTGIFSFNLSDGTGIVSNGASLSTGNVYEGQNDGTTTFSIDKEGNIISESLVLNDLPINRVLISNGSSKVSESAVTTTELSYVSGVTSALQTQLNAKLNSSTYTSDWSGLNSGNFLRSDATATKTTGSLVVNDGINIDFGTDADVRQQFTGANFQTNLLTGNWNILGNGVTRFTFGRTTGNFIATGAGEFTGTVSGSDPVNADDFVTKGYGESNFATVESGTFTPTLFSSTGSPVYTIGSSVCQYVKIGRLVHISIQLNSISNTGSPSGTFEIRGLPFNSDITSVFSGIITGGSNSTANTDFVCSIGQDYINTRNAGSVAALNPGSFTGGTIWITGTYETDE